MSSSTPRSPLRPRKLAGALALLPALLLAPAAHAMAPSGPGAVFTTTADFETGTLVNTNTSVPDQVQLDGAATPFNFIWVAASQRGTVVKIDTTTGAILGEFRTAPSSYGYANPSRTTVDNDGSVWVANRGGSGAVIHIGLVENNQCEDRNGNGVIDTSDALGDILPWTSELGARRVATAADECIVSFTRVASSGTRHLSVDAFNDVWVSGTGGRVFQLIQGGRYDTPGAGSILRTEPSVGYGGYGGLMDASGVIWSARPLLRWDIANPLTGPNGDPPGLSIGPTSTNWAGQTSPDSYGLCIDPSGNVWNTQLHGNLIHKYAPDGTHLGAFPHGNANAQGCVADANGDIWVAHSLFSSTTVGHLLNDGTHVGNVPLGAGHVGPTGVAVDGDGKIWAANINTDNVVRIDPALGPVGGGGVPVGAVDLSVSLGAGAGPYNYSDMTGSTLTAPPSSGTWSTVFDCITPNAVWSGIDWNADEPGDSAITVTAASGPTAAGPFSAPVNVTSGGALTLPDGQYLELIVDFQRSTTTDGDGDGVNDTPILFDIAFECGNTPPDFDDDPDDAIFKGCGDLVTVTLPIPTATDDQGPPVITGTVIEVNGVPSSLAVINGVVDLPIGEHLVEWIATDPFGEIDTVYQVVIVKPAIFGVDKIRFADRANTEALLGSYGTAELGVHAESGTILAEDRVTLRNFATVNGDVVTMANLNSQYGATVTGSITTYAATADLPFIDLTVTSGPGGANLVVNSGTSQTLTPGDYGRVIVNSNADLVLLAGHYTFTNFIVNSGSVLDYGAGTTIATGNMTFRGVQAGPGPLDVTITGSGWVHFEQDFEGSIFAPLASLRLAGNGGPVYTGCYLARQLLVETDTTLVCTGL